jgi:hypothetical protein
MIRLHLIDSYLLESLVENNFKTNPFKNLKTFTLFPFVNIVFNRLFHDKNFKALESMKKQLDSFYFLHSISASDIKKTIDLLKNNEGLNWNLKWLLPLKDDYELMIFTSNEASQKLYKRERIRNELIEP